MNACLTAAEFDALFHTLRPQLVGIARRLFGASCDDDAQDLVSETYLVARHILHKFQPDDSAPNGGLLSWLKGVMGYAAANERKRTRRRPQTVPIEAAANVPAPPDPNPTDHRQQPTGPRPLPWAWPSLPYNRQVMVRAWLDGKSQAEIGRLFTPPLHRNTVGNRLELAFEALRIAMPHPDKLRYSFSLINYCSRHYVYQHPSGQSRRWFTRTPPDICFFRLPTTPSAPSPPLPPA